MTKYEQLDYLMAHFGEAIYDLARLMSTHGDEKHGERGSCEMPIMENIQHLKNHLSRILQNKHIDKDSGETAALAMMARAMIIHEQAKDNPDINIYHA